MSDVEFAYLLRSIDGSVADEYLKNTFNRNLQIKSNRPLCLFACGLRGDCPPSFQEIVARFPHQSFFFSFQPSTVAIIIVAEPQKFHEIVDYSETLDCSVLHWTLSAELKRDFQPEFQIRGEVWHANRPKVMGILNITPDSFYDGGKFYQKDDYVIIADEMIKEGADIIDIGGESTRPGSQQVSAAEEIRRILPAVEQIRRRFSIPISVDTVKPEVAAAVLEKGADMINDTSGLSADIDMIEVIKQFRAGYCLMHTQGTPDKMQLNPQYTDVISEVYCFFKKKLKRLYDSGIAKNQICIDPGIGFGKMFNHNLFLQQFVAVYKNLGQLILLGTSNKSFIGQALNRDTSERLIGSMVTQVMGWINGATIFRVHDIDATSDALTIANLFNAKRT